MPAALAQTLILRRLRAPRLAHHQTPADLGSSFADAQRLRAASAGRAELLAVQAGHDLGPALGPHGPAIVGFLRQSLLRWNEAQPSHSAQPPGLVTAATEAVENVAALGQGLGVTRVETHGSKQQHRKDVEQA